MISNCESESELILVDKFRTELILSDRIGNAPILAECPERTLF